MYKTKINYPNSSTSKQKKLPPRPKPEFSTDFIDRDKYKLSQAQMIQKKASLQSRHRQEAIKDLQERRRKLEQGIIDEDTRKVYQTALTSKNIDLNPPPRKNLSQMIQYERQKLQQRSGSRERQRPVFQRQIEVGSEEESQNEEIQKQLKETRDFIKKLQRVKKVDNIQRAVDIIAEPVIKKKELKKSREKSQQKSVDKKMPLNNQRILKDLKQSKSSAVSSQEEALSSIQDTIRFMEERLFSAKRIEKIKQQEVSKVKESSFSNQYLANHSPRNQVTENLELSQLRIHETQSQDQCLKTIRRMKEMMEGNPFPLESSRLKENRQAVSNRMVSFQEFSTLQKPSPHIAQSEAEVDFSLTMNQSEPHSILKNKPNHFEEEREYQRLKKSLFQQVNRLQLQTPEVSVVQASFNAKANNPPIIDQSSISNLRCMPTPPQKTKKINPELAKLRNQIQSVRDSVECIKVQPLAITRPGQVMGIDFRGSINIKKHVVQQK